MLQTGAGTGLQFSKSSVASVKQQLSSLKKFVALEPMGPNDSKARKQSIMSLKVQHIWLFFKFCRSNSGHQRRC